MESSKRLSDYEVHKIKAEVALVRNRFKDAFGAIIRDEIFQILEESGTLIFYPLEEKNVWGMYLRKRERDYFIINSSIELEKQIFAAAHELAHSLPIAKSSGEVIMPETLAEYVENGVLDKLDKDERIANRFAAELLVGEDELVTFILRAPKYLSLVAKLVYLSDTFLVPYRTVAKRLFEVGLIKKDNLESLLSISKQEVELISDKYDYRKLNKQVSSEKRLGNYTRKAIMLYENDLSNYDMLEERLKLIDENPEMYDVFEELDIFDLYPDD